MSTSKTIDLSRLPSPDVVEALDYETTLAARRDAFLARVPQDERDAIEQTIALDSEPATIVLQENAYRELVLRERINEAARACMIAFARGADLDQLVALLGVERLVVEAGDPQASPPLPASYETDDDLRKRAVMALEGYPTAGSVGAYEFHAYSAHADVKDVAVTSPAPGLVQLVILAHSGDGVPGDDVLDGVRRAVTADHVRPLTDTVEVLPARVVSYTVRATLFVESGPSPEAIRASAMTAIAAYAQDRRTLGAYVALSGIAAALHQPGVRRIEIDSPRSDLVQAFDQSAHMALAQLDVQVRQ